MCCAWATRKLLCRVGGGVGRPANEGGVPEMGFRAGPFVLCKDGCCRQRRRNTNFGPEKFFSRKIFPPHMCSQNDQRDVGIILSHTCWGRPPPPPPARQVGQPRPKPPSRHGGRGGQMGFHAIPPPPPHKAIFFPPCPLTTLTARSGSSEVDQSPLQVRGSGRDRDTGKTTGNGTGRGFRRSSRRMLFEFLAAPICPPVPLCKA